MPNSRHRAASPGWPAEVSITMVGAGDRRILLDGLCQREAIRIGHLEIGQHESEGPSRFLRRAQRGERFGHARRQRGDHAPADEHLFEQAAVRGVVVDDEDGQVPQIDRVGDRRHAAGAPTSAKLAVKWNVLPLPASLSTQTRPPISCTSCEEMVRPSPVPP